MYDLAAVMVRRRLTNVQPESYGLRNEFTAAREATAQAVRNEGAARAREAGVVATRDNARTE